MSGLHILPLVRLNKLTSGLISCNSIGLLLHPPFAFVCLRYSGIDDYELMVHCTCPSCQQPAHVAKIILHSLCHCTRMMLQFQIGMVELLVDSHGLRQGLSMIRDQCNEDHISAPKEEKAQPSLSVCDSVRWTPAVAILLAN